MTSKDCIFCKIVKGEIPKKFDVETKNVTVFPDINPVAETHFLIVPKKHINSVLTISTADAAIIAEMFEAAKKIVEVKKLSAFRLAFNGGKYQHVPHLHMHLLAGGSVQWKKL